MRLISTSYRVMMSLLGAMAATACTGDKHTTLVAPRLDPVSVSSVLGWPPVSILAVGSTQQLSATGVAVSGEPIAAFDSAWFFFPNIYQSQADTSRVRLSSIGLITAVAPTTTPVELAVVGFKGGVGLGDMVLVQVTAAAIPGLTLSIQPAAPDSAKLAAGVTKAIVPVLRNPGTGATVANPAMRYLIKPEDQGRVQPYAPIVLLRLPSKASNRDIGYFYRWSSSVSPASNQIVPLTGEGSAWIYATVNAYGTMLRDSVRYTFTYPYTKTIATVKANLAIASLYDGQTLTLAPGATVTFQNGVAAADPLQIAYTFDVPGAATAASPASMIGGSSGNVASLSGSQTSKRRFPTPGTYRWTATAAGGPAPWDGQSVSGMIVIK